MYDLYVCFTLVRWLPHPTRKSLVSRRSTSAIFPHRHSLAFCCSQAVKNKTQALASFSRKQWGMWSLRTVLRPGCCELARSCNLHIPITTLIQYLTTHNTFGTRRDAKAQVGAAVVKIFVTRQRPALVVPWQSGPQTAHFAPHAMQFPLCYALAWNFGRRSGMTRKTLVREMSTVFFALWGLSRLRVRDDSLCEFSWLPAASALAWKFVCL